MRLVHDPQELRAACDEARAGGRLVAIVPTMGALHEGHLRLVDEARARAGAGGLVVVTVFVNPTQFGPNEDFSRYPRTLEADVAAVAARGADVVFAPEAAALYPPGEETRVRPGATSGPLCGASRPGHFEGVATVVTKLFALCAPCVAVFGRKDYQQLQVVRRLARDLFLPVDVVGVPTVREPDGLAMSSRNRYLSPEDRGRALSLARGLSAAAGAWAAGERGRDALVGAARRELDAARADVDYVELADPERLTLHGPGASLAAPAVLAVAARIGATRLIDNLVLGVDAAPIRGAEAARA